jgi:hypothetical protein
MSVAPGRSLTVEPALGQVKDARGEGRFLLRGLDGESGEWKLLCGTHCLLRLWRHVCRQAGSGKARWN